jgi:HSP20 family protein
MRYRHVGVRSNLVMSLSAPEFGWQLTRTTVVLSEPGWRPDTDVYETDSSIVIVADLAGLAEDDFELLLFDDALVIEGHRTVPPLEQRAVYRVAAIRQGPFRIAIGLPEPVDPDHVSARYDAGLLRVTLGKTPGG